MKGSIVDVYPEGKDAFRACILKVVGGDKEIAKVVNLDTGEKSEHPKDECSEPVIENIFEVEESN